MPNEDLTGFLRALNAEGVDPTVVDPRLYQRVEADVDAPTVMQLGTSLLEHGAASPEQLQRAQQRWAASSAPAQPAQRLGHYAIERRLGTGASGEVYLVRDPATGAELAAKRLLGGLEGGQERQRFKREARALAQLDHPHVARIHAAELGGPEPYFVLGYYPGGTLSDRLRQGPLCGDDARELLAKLADAVAAAHEQGILHRDLKPANVLFDDQGEPQLSDFGLGFSLNAHANRLTQTGAVLGTPSYMPPEQASDAKQVDQRSDVFGLGALLYVCLTGQPPFPSQGNVLATLKRVLECRIEPPSKLATVDPELEAICMRALAQDPGERFPSAAAFRDALRAAGAKPPEVRSGTVPIAFAALALVFACAGVSALALGQSWQATPSPSSQPDLPPANPPALSTEPERDARQPPAEPAAPPLPRRSSEPLADPVGAWREAMALGPGKIGEAALRVLDRIEREALQPGAGVTPQVAVLWQRAWDLNHCARAILVADFGSRLRERDELDALWEAVRSVDGAGLPPPLEAALFVRAYDAWLHGVACLPLVEQKEFAERLVLPQTLRHRSRPVDVAGWLLVHRRTGMLIGQDMVFPEPRMVLEVKTPQLLRNFTPHLLVDALNASSPFLDPENMRTVRARLQGWVELAAEDPPFGNPHVLTVCIRLAGQQLQAPRETSGLELAAAVLDLAQRLPGARAAGLESVALARAQVALCQGRWAEVDRYLARTAPGRGPSLLAAALALLRARELPPGERGALLDDARQHLERAAGESRLEVAMRCHLTLLSGESFDPASLGQLIGGKGRGGQGDTFLTAPLLLPWYLQFNPEQNRFPCQTSLSSRDALWLPGTLYAEPR